MIGAQGSLFHWSDPVTVWPRWLKEWSLNSPSSRHIKYVLERAAIAETEDDADTMRQLSYKLLRLEQYERAWQLRMRATALKQQSPIPEWDGSNLAGRSILIRSYAPKSRIGEELRLARFIAPVAERARRCMVLAEPRLVPLLRRSFAGVDVRPRDVDDSAALAEVEVAAYYETIAFHFTKTAEEMRRSFVALRGDPALISSIRQRYTKISHGPLVGISWGSSNEKKVLPDPRDWAPLLGWTSANFVSLQYGDIKHDLEVLQGFADGRVIHDAKIDQFVDLDGFAAQIAALDAVVSISNTTIDMAGMLGAPTIHIRGDKASQIWPQSGPSPWYPSMTFLYKQQRPWADAFAEARSYLEQMMSLTLATLLLSLQPLIDAAT
jgi:hypothetical protein